MAQGRSKTDSPLVVDGIKVNCTLADAQDFEIVELSAAAMDETLSEDERGRAVTMAATRIPVILFGPDWKRIKGELREKHDGKLTMEMVDEFTGHVFEALNRKN